MRFAVFATAGNRPCLRDAIQLVRYQVDKIIVVVSQGGDLDAVMAMLDGVNNWVLHYEGSPFNLSRSWQSGVRIAEEMAVEAGAEKWFVAILNDDAMVPANWVHAVTRAMEETAASAGSSGSPYPHRVLHIKSGRVPLHERMQGWAFILRGDDGVEPDPTFAWWFGDDDIAWRAAAAGGTVLIPGFPVRNLYPNSQFTPELHAQAAKDAQAFVDKHGVHPWA